VKRTTAPDLPAPFLEWFPALGAWSQLLDALDLTPQRTLGELRHRQLLGRSGKGDHGVADLAEQFSRKVKRRPSADDPVLGFGPLLLPRPEKLSGGIALFSGHT
jgi:hypothetical protein